MSVFARSVRCAQMWTQLKTNSSTKKNRRRAISIDGGKNTKAFSKTFLVTLFWGAINPWKLHQRILQYLVRAVFYLGLLGLWGKWYQSHKRSNGCVNMLRIFFFQRMDEMNFGYICWFQQDGTTAHTAKASMTFQDISFLWLVNWIDQHVSLI